MKRINISRYGEKQYIQLENSRFVRKSGILAIVDFDKSCYSKVTRKFLSQREKDGRLIVASDGLPKSYVVYDDGRREESYLSVFGVDALRKRVE